MTLPGVATWGQRAGVILACCLYGCALDAETHETYRAGADVTRTTLTQQDLSAVKTVVEEVVADLDVDIQTGLVNKHIVDNRTYDTFAYRLTVGGLVVLALSYPVGKLVWILAGFLRPRRKRHGAKV